MHIHAIVKRKQKLKHGRGFSRSELRAVGLNGTEALKFGIAIDPKRTTKHEENVQTLTTYVNDVKSRLARTSEKPKIVELRAVKGIGPKTAEKLGAAGIQTANDLVSSNPQRIAELLGTSEDKASSLLTVARSLIKQS